MSRLLNLQSVAGRVTNAKEITEMDSPAGSEDYESTANYGALNNLQISVITVVMSILQPDVHLGSRILLPLVKTSVFPASASTAAQLMATLRQCLTNSFALGTLFWYSDCARFA